MQLLTATLIKPARQVTTKYGERTAADIRLQDGSEATLWRPAGDATLANLTPGQSVTVAKDSKGKVNLIDNSPTVTAPPAAVTPTPTLSPVTETLTPETKRAIAAYVGDMADLYFYCYETAGNKLPTAPMEARQAMASSLFIAAQRKFNLA